MPDKATLESFIRASSDASLIGDDALDMLAEVLKRVEAKGYKVSDARNQLPDLRERAKAGDAAVIADRGAAASLSATTLMLSASTLLKLFEAVAAHEKERRLQSDLGSALIARFQPVGRLDGPIALPKPAADQPGVGADQLRWS